MTKLVNPEQPRSVRRAFRQVFDRFIKRLNFDCPEKIEKLDERQRNIEELIDVVARNLAEQSKPRKRQNRSKQS